MFHLLIVSLLSFVVQFVAAIALLYPYIIYLLFSSLIIKGAVSVCKMDLTKDELGDYNFLASGIYLAFFSVRKCFSIRINNFNLV